MLDPQGKDEIKRVIMELHKESGLTIVSITHDVDEVTGSDAVIVLDQGKVAMTGTPREIFAQSERLKNMHLELPFALQLSEQLKKHGVSTGDEITMEGVVEALCRLHLNR